MSIENLLESEYAKQPWNLVSEPESRSRLNEKYPVMEMELRHESN